MDLSRVHLQFAPGCDHCLDYWLRFAVFYGAKQLEVSWKKHQWVVEFAAPGPDLEELRALLVHPQLGARYLGMGALAAQAHGAREVVLETSRALVVFDGQGHRVDPTRRLRDKICRLTVRGRLGQPTWPDFRHAGLTVRINGQDLAVPAPEPPNGLRLLLHGVALRYQGPPLLPPDTGFEVQLEHGRLDLMLHNLSLSAEQVEEVQSRLEAVLGAAPQRSLAQLEWLQLRLFASRRWDEALRLARLQPAPHPEEPFAAAYYERMQHLCGLSTCDPWRHEPHWQLVLSSGLLPDLEESWLRPTYAQFRGRLAALAYRRALRHSWGETGPDGDFLQALWGFRRDTLGGNYLLAGCLLELRPSQLPRSGADFCLAFLQAALAGQEAGPEMAQLSPEQRGRVAQRTARLAEHLRA